MTRSGAMPRRTSSGYTSAALPITAIDRACFFAPRCRRTCASASSRSLGDDVEVARLHPAPGPRRVHLHAEEDRAVHRGRQGLRAAHATEPAGEHEPSGQVIRAEVGPAGLGERLVGALQDPLRADVDPRARGHLPVHHQALRLELPEVLPGGPASDQVRVGDQHARARRGASASRPPACPTGPAASRRRPSVRSVATIRSKRGPVARGLAGAAVDHQVLGTLGHLGVEVVHQHPERRLLHPAAAAALRSPGRPDHPSRHCLGPPTGRHGRRRRLSYDGRTKHSSPPGAGAEGGCCRPEPACPSSSWRGCLLQRPGGCQPARAQAREVGWASVPARLAADLHRPHRRRPPALPERVPGGRISQGALQRVQAGHPRRSVQAGADRLGLAPGLHHRPGGPPVADRGPADGALAGQPGRGSRAHPAPGAEEDRVRGHPLERPRRGGSGSGGSPCCSASSSGPG